MLGCTVTLAEENDPDTVDMFARREYTVVGLVNAVTYLNFERGSTSLAGGTASGFLYLLPRRSPGEYYTEIYLTVPSTGEIYSSEYQAAVDGARERSRTFWTAVRSCGMRRSAPTRRRR